MLINRLLTINFNFTEFLIHCFGDFQEIPEPDQEDVLNHCKIQAQKLQSFRNVIKKPIIVLSGWRSVSHNRKVGGAKNSMHLYGIATDITYSGIEDTWKHDFEILKTIFKCVIWYPDQLFFHCDHRVSTRFYSIDAGKSSI